MRARAHTHTHTSHAGAHMSPRRLANSHKARPERMRYAPIRMHTLHHHQSPWTNACTLSHLQGPTPWEGFEARPRPGRGRSTPGPSLGGVGPQGGLGSLDPGPGTAGTAVHLARSVIRRRAGPGHRLAADLFKYPGPSRSR